MLGYLDDLLIVPAGIWLAVRLIPPPLMAELREEADRRAKPTSKAAAVVIVAVWLAVAAAFAWLWLR